VKINWKSKDLEIKVGDVIPVSGFNHLVKVIIGDMCYGEIADSFHNWEMKTEQLLKHKKAAVVGSL